MWQRVANVLWWLGLSAYFGGIVTIAAIAPVVFRTTHEAGIMMPGIFSPPLDISNQAGGEIFGAVLNRFAVVELVALGLMLLGLAGFLLGHTPVRRSVWVLLIFWVLLTSLVGYDSGVLRPRVFAVRDEVRLTAAAHAGDAKDALAAVWPQRAEFNRLHERAESLAHVKAYLLLGMLLVAAWPSLVDRGAKQKLTRAELMREEL